MYGAWQTFFEYSKFQRTNTMINLLTVTVIRVIRSVDCTNPRLILAAVAEQLIAYSGYFAYRQSV